MRHTCNINCKLLDDIDLFGKDPELYYKGNSKRVSYVGKLFTLLYVIIYVGFFLYKLIRMLKKVDVTFYQTSTYTGETPSLYLDNEQFYGGFALGDPNTLLTFVDERIYYPLAFFRIGRKNGLVWNWEVIPLEVEKCKLEKFGAQYRDMFKTKDLNNLYCLKNMDVTLEGHTTYDVYSFFYIAFYPCVNTTENHNMCAPIEEIQQKLDYSMVSVKIQDIELTPESYDSPTQIRVKELSSPSYKNLYQNINAYFHIVNVETDEDIIGFELLKNIKTKKYFKYDDTFILPSINNRDIYNIPYQAIADITIQLSEDIITLKRTNTKLIEVLGDVGGVMEVIYSFFRIVSSFLTDTLYEQSIVNNLFSFDLDKKIIKIKQKKNKNKILPSDDIKIHDPSKPLNEFSPKNNFFINDEENIQTNSRLNSEIINKKLENPNLTNGALKVKKKKRRKIKKKEHISTNILSNPLSNEFKNQNALEDELNKKEINNFYIKNNHRSDNNLIINKEKVKNDEINVQIEKSENENKNENKNESESENRNIINKIKLNRLCICCCFLCVRRQNNMHNVLLNEGMKIVSEKLDILYLFRTLTREEKLQEKLIEKETTIDMSDECKIKLQHLYNSNKNRKHI